MKVLGLMTTIAAMVAAGAIVGGWLLMLTVGVIHGEWLPMMPTLGFWSALKVSFMLSLTVGFGFGLSQANNS